MYMFITGLRPSLKNKVQMKIPQELEEAVEAADYYESIEFDIVPVTSGEGSIETLLIKGGVL